MPPRPVPQTPTAPIGSSIGSGFTSTTATTVTNTTMATSKSAKSKSTTTANVELEFTQRFLSLFTSFYDTPSIDDIISFPAAKPNPQPEVKSTSRNPPFHSGVWDLRLKKSIDLRLANDQLTSDSLSEQVTQLRETLQSDSADLNDIFAPQKVERQQIPLYLQNMEKDDELINEDRRKRVKPVSSNVAEMTNLFTERLKRQKSINKERGQRRFQCAKELSQQHMEFVKTLHRCKYQETYNAAKFDKARYQEIKERREKQLQQGKSAVEEMRAKSPMKSPRKETVTLL